MFAEDHTPLRVDWSLLLSDSKGRSVRETVGWMLLSTALSLVVMANNTSPFGTTFELNYAQNT